MSDTPLHLLHLRPDPRRLAAWAARHRLLNDQGDLGYALHGLLNAAFGEHAPQPFRYLDAEQGLLAYAPAPLVALQRCAALAEPEVAAALGLGATNSHGGMSARVFPTQWPEGHVLGFETRVRPVIREGRSGNERDAFLAAVEKIPEAAIDRNEVYLNWLREHLERQGGARLLDATVTRWRLLDVMRQEQRSTPGEPRKRRSVRGPDVELRGHLQVADPAAFAALLARGVGRHRSFGFGMLLLRPAAD